MEDDFDDGGDERDDTMMGEQRRQEQNQRRNQAPGEPSHQGIARETQVSRNQGYRTVLEEFQWVENVET